MSYDYHDGKEFDQDMERLRQRREIPHYTATTCSWSNNPDEETFGTLQSKGILDKRYEHSGGCDPDNVAIIWTVNEHCAINGTEYNVGEEIVWPK